MVFQVWDSIFLLESLSLKILNLKSLNFSIFLCSRLMSVSSSEMKGILVVLVDRGFLYLGVIMAVLLLFVGCPKLDWSIRFCYCGFLEFVLHMSLGWNLFWGSVMVFCDIRCDWCGSLDLSFYANEHFCWLLISFINRLSFQEVDFCVFYSIGDIYYITFCSFNFLFYYFNLLCWKVFFFASGGIEILGAGSTPFFEGLNVLSTLFCLLFWAWSSCHPSMLLGFYVI